MEYFITILTALIAVIAVYIAWHQWKTNRNKLKLDIFDRRFAIYKKVEKAINLINSESNPDGILDDLRTFYHSTFVEAYFLFGEEIQDYISMIFDKGNKYWAQERILKSTQLNKKPHYDDAAAQASEIQLKEKEWFYAQNKLLAKKFEKYLCIDDRPLSTLARARRIIYLYIKRPLFVQKFRQEAKDKLNELESMGTLDLLNAKINVKLVKLRIKKIEPCAVYSLDQNNKMPRNMKANFFWPDKWPYSDNTGIYTIFSKEKLLYIGKSSEKLGERLSDYFKKDEYNKVKFIKKYIWSYQPTHVVIWKLEIASANLEELKASLISDPELNPCDNTQNRSDS